MQYQYQFPPSKTLNMRQKIFILLLCYFFLGISSNAQVSLTATSGTLSGSYTTVKGAFDAINAGTHHGVITITLTGNTTETSSAALNASGSGSSVYLSVRIYPTNTGITISGNLGSPLIDLNGADNVTIDGRVNATGLTADLTIRNTNTSGGNTSTIRFINDATYNTVKYCKLQGSSTNAASGILFFSTTTGASGNSNNTAERNEITCAGINRPYSAIYSSGSSGGFNSSNTISNNSIYNVLSSNSEADCINLGTYNTAWTITGNSFYETTLTTPAGGNNINIIYINTTSGTNFTISDNYIGGNAPLCGGTWTKSAGNNTFYFMQLRVGTGTASNIQGNTIKNINYTNSGNYNCYGIDIYAGDVNIGTTAGNCIGASSGTGSIVYTCNGSNARFVGIHVQNPDRVYVQNNIIGSITTANANSANSTNFYGIYLQTNGGIYSASNNTVGSITTSNSINATSASSTDAQTVCGIISEGNSGTISISNNTVVNLINGTTNTDPSKNGKIYGIYSYRNTNTVTGNTVHDLSISNANTSTGTDPGNPDNTSLSAAGLAITTNSNTSQTVSGNTVYNISNTYASFQGNIAGIYFWGQSIANTIEKNLIYGLSVNPGSTSATIHGIKISAGVATYSNNIITLGGNTSSNLYGFYEAGSSGTNNIYFNTVYLGGSPTAGSNNSYCLYNAGTSSNRDFRNNIFNNARSNNGASGIHYGLYFVNTGGSLNCNYNDYWISGTGGKLGYYGGDKTVLPIVTGVTGNDASSLSLLPDFFTPGGITANSYIPSAALPAATGTGILTDFGGTTRSGSPEMGAWEQSNSLTWNGGNSQDWNTATNWTPNLVPTASHNVLVPDLTNDPVVNESIGTPAMCNDLTIETGAVLTISAGKALTVNGTFTNNAGNSGLVIESDETGTGSLIQNSASVGATIQMYITGTTDPEDGSMYHFVSIPTWYSDPLSGLFLGSYLYVLDATQADPANNDYYGKWVHLGSPTTTPLSMTSGYMIFYPEDSHTYSFSGYLNTGTFSPTVSYGGTYTFNLVPNPYPSAINWGASGGWLKSNIGAVAWIWDSSTGNYTTLSGNSYVPAGQAFIVMTSGTPVLTMDNNACVHNSQAFYKSDQPDALKISARSNNYYDETFVGFNSSATDGFDLELDGFKLWGVSDAPQLWTEAGANNMSINMVPAPSERLTVPLDFKTSFSGEAELTFSGMDNFDPSLPIRLEDRLTGSVTDLRKSDTYVFSHDPANTEKRFNLIFGNPVGISENGNINCQLWIADESVFINPVNRSGKEGTLEIFDLLGQKLFGTTVDLNHQTRINPPVKGMVLVRLTTKGKIFTTRGMIK